MQDNIEKYEDIIFGIIQSMVLTAQKVTLNKNARYQFYKIMINQFIYYKIDLDTLEKMKYIDPVYDEALTDYLEGKDGRI